MCILKEGKSRRGKLSEYNLFLLSLERFRYNDARSALAHKQTNQMSEKSRPLYVSHLLVECFEVISFEVVWMLF